MKNMRNVALIASLLIGSLLPNCTRQDEFRSVALGDVRLDLDSTEVEFLLPDADGELVAISGELLEGEGDIGSVASSIQFELEFIYRDGHRKRTGWLSPTIANWHNSQAGFVISKAADEDHKNGIEKIRLSMKRKDLKMNNKARIKIYSNYIK